MSPPFLKFHCKLDSKYESLHGIALLIRAENESRYNKALLCYCVWIHIYPHAFSHFLKRDKFMSSNLLSWSVLLFQNGVFSQKTEFALEGANSFI